LLLRDVSVAMLKDGVRALQQDDYAVVARAIDVADRASVAAFDGIKEGIGRLQSFVVTAGNSPRSADPKRILGSPSDAASFASDQRLRPGENARRKSSRSATASSQPR